LRSNAKQLADRLALASGDTSKKQFLDWLATRNYTAALAQCESVMSAEWAEVVCHTVKAALSRRSGELLDAYTHQEAAFEAFLRVFKTLSRHWCPILRVLVIDLRRIGAQADAQQRERGNPAEAIKLEGAGRVMRKCLAQELRDDDNEHHMLRTFGALHVANQCQRVFFALNTLKHVKSLVLPPGLAVQEYPAADRVTWHFFQGRMALMESRFDQAEQVTSPLSSHGKKRTRRVPRPRTGRTCRVQSWRAGRTCRLPSTTAPRRTSPIAGASSRTSSQCAAFPS